MKEFAPFVLQGLVMGVDEFYCHQRRTLNKWERLGHPADTITFMACLAFLIFAEPGSVSLPIYVVLSVISCLFVTKDEWQHRELCNGFENWLHALLFMLHPVVLIWAGYLWWSNDPSSDWVLPSALALSGGFFFYQLLYWNVWRRDQQ